MKYIWTKVMYLREKESCDRCNSEIGGRVNGQLNRSDAMLAVRIFANVLIPLKMELSRQISDKFL
jgi:hypothetical protein